MYKRASTNVFLASEVTPGRVLQDGLAWYHDATPHAGWVADRTCLFFGHVFLFISSARH